MSANLKGDKINNIHLYFSKPERVRENMSLVNVFYHYLSNNVINRHLYIFVMLHLILYSLKFCCLAHILVLIENICRNFMKTIHINVFYLYVKDNVRLN